MSVKVFKTVKLFIGGAFPRTESGRVVAVKLGANEANLCVASRKDLRQAVEAAEAAAGGWAKASAYNRGQILYRAAEMIEGRRPEFAQLFADTLGWDAARANREIDAGIDAFVYYAGFTDKLSQVRGAVNPVASRHHVFTTPEPVGVVGLILPDAFSFGAMCDDLASILAGGNSVVALLPLGDGGKGGCPAVLAPLAECLATSDLPGGVVNLLTGELAELAPWFGSHMEIRALSYRHEDRATLALIQKAGVENMKRVVAYGADTPPLKRITSFMEYKTAWHPVGA
ncbi:MAG: aldehyde dehydrogenase family protein [Bdellovibrionales bacterium]|nr:aldehyde dehydrogenase family protein [Bdellovibrionales bacterium]